MGSLESFWRAVVALGDAIGSIGFVALAIALGLQLLAQLIRAVAWRNIIGAALHDAPVAYGPVCGGLLAGSGLNGILPARAGDLLKLFLVRTRVARTSYPTLASSLVPETLFNSAMATLLLLWAWYLGVLPSLPDIPAFELSLMARHPDWTGTIAILVVGALAAVAIIQRPRLERIWGDLSAGLRILRFPRRYLRTVVSLQALAWLARLAAAWFFLDAFGVDATLRNAAIVMMVHGVSSALPLTPGGVGPKQALLLVLIDGEASAILAFSVGMEVALVAFQALVGLIAAGIMLDGFHIRETLRRARAERAREASTMQRD